MCGFLCKISVGFVTVRFPCPHKVTKPTEVHSVGSNALQIAVGQSAGAIADLINLDSCGIPGAIGAGPASDLYPYAYSDIFRIINISRG
jgi:hypothetical protein